MKDSYRDAEMSAKAARQMKHLGLWSAVRSLGHVVISAENLHARICGTPQGATPQEVEPEPSLLQTLDDGEKRIMASVAELEKCLAAIEAALF